MDAFVVHLPSLEKKDDGLISRKVYVEVPPKAEYALTETRRELLPFLSLLRDWAKQQLLINNVEAMSKFHLSKRLLSLPTISTYILPFMATMPKKLIQFAR